MINSGNCCLMIRGNDLYFDEIEKNLEIKPSRMVKKGELVSKVVGKSQYDLWTYEIKINETNPPNLILKQLLSKLNPCKAYLQKISMSADILIKCYVQSDYAQISFEFLPDVLKELANLDIKLEISILSWGKVIS